MASPLPTMQYLLALSNNALDDPALITSVAAPGVLGAVNVWTDVTAYVAAHQISRGRQHELARFESGACALDVRNDDGRFNSWNTQGPYFGKLVPMVQVQVRATYSAVTYKLFTGMVNAWPIHWPDNFSSMAQISCSDAFRVLSLADITNSQYKQAVLGDVPFAYYRMDDTGAICADSSGNNYNGYYNGQGTQGVAGALITDPDAAYDTGDHKGYVTLTANSAFGNTFTFECWVQFHAQPVSNTDHLWSQGDATSTTFAILVPAAQSGVNIGMQIILQDATRSQVYQATVPAVDGKYHHIAATRTGNTFLIYFDGVSQAVSLITDTGTVVMATATKAGIGRSIGSETPAGNFLIDEVAVYGGVLTPTQILAHYNANVLGGALSGARVNKVLDVVGWSAGARNIDAGDTTLQAVSASLATTKALSHLQLVEQTEDAALFMTTDGKVRFVQRSNLLKAPFNVSQATYGDNAGEFVYQVAPDLALDDLDLFNEGITSNNNGVTQIFSDATSVTKYGRRTQSLSGLLATVDSFALARAQWLVARFKTPVPRLRKIEVRPLDAPATLFPETLTRELLDRITVIRHGVPGSGDPFISQAQIEHIDDTMTPDSWVRTYALANVLPAVGLYNDGTYGRWSDTSPLTNTITAGAASLTVTIVAGAPAWTTVDVPLNIQVDAEIATVSAIGAVGGGQQVLTLSARGVNNTVAAAHTAGVLVQPYPATVWGF